MMSMTKINCVGDICPVPVIKVKKALAAGEAFEVLVDNEIAVQNISKLLDSQNCSFSTLKEEEFFLMQIAAISHVHTGQSLDNLESKLFSTGDSQSPVEKSIVVISSEYMGTGDDILGKILIKGFIFALTQLEVLPQAIIFYNGGVRHVLQNSEAIADLQYLHNQGVSILSCGTCLTHLGVADKLAVGEITNMYDIITLQQRATRIIKP